MSTPIRRSAPDEPEIAWVPALNDEYNQLQLALDFGRLLVNRNEDGTSDDVWEGIFTTWGDGSGFRRSSQHRSRVLVRRAQADRAPHRVLLRRPNFGTASS